MITNLVSICLLLHGVMGAPQRSVQLGGGGPRPVIIGGQEGPAYQQALTFGPPSHFTAQNAVPQLNSIPQLLPQRGNLRPFAFQGPQGPQQYQVTHQPTAQPTYSQTPLPLRTFPPFPSATPGPLLLKSPSLPPQEEEEYEDEYEEEPQKPAQVPATTQRPTPPPRQPSRQPIRITTNSVQAQPQQPQQYRITPNPQQPQRTQFPGSQRFVVPQQPQQQQQILVEQPQQYQATAVPSRRPQPNRVIANQPVRFGQDNRVHLEGGKQRLSTPPPVQTINRFMKTNDDGSMSWGYENEDGTFKEETLGIDCVVRGKYGYVDPDGNKREYEYQSGNPCDPNKKAEEEAEEDEEQQPVQQRVPERVGGILTGRPLQQRRQPVILS